MSTNSNPQISPIAQIRALHDRLVKAESLVTEHKVHPVINMPDHYVVEGVAGFYIVNGSCSCNDATKRNDLIKGHCKHRLAVFLYAEQQAQSDTPKATRKAQAESPEDKELAAKVNDLYR
jgi:hypothetical protein